MDGNDIWVSQLWRELDRLREDVGVNEVQFHEVVFLLLAMQYLYADDDAVNLSEGLRKDIEYLLSGSISYEKERLDLFVRSQADLFQQLQIPSYNDSRPAAHSEAFLVPLIQTLHYFRHASPSGSWLRATDHAFHKSIPRSSPANRRASQAAVELALNFLPRSLRLVDHFMDTADFAVRAADRVGRGVSVYSEGLSRANQSLLHLRVLMHHATIVRADPSMAYRHPNRVALLAHPDHKSDRKRRRPPELRTVTNDGRSLMTTTSKYDTAIESLSLLLDDGSFRIAIVAVPMADCTASGWREDLRKRLVEKNLLLAVIGGASLKKSDRQIAYWLVSNRPIEQNGVLFINLSLLAAEDDADAAEMMLFAACIIRKRYPELEHDLFPLAELERYQGLYSRYFGSGYQNVEGLCELVPPERMDAASWSTNPALYIVPMAKNEAVRHRLDGRAIMDVLVNRQFPLCAYVIGNNGQGKSMLLAQLADELSEYYSHTAGIAFGLTDRFRFNSAVQADRGFRYLGARTTETSVSVSITRHRLHSYVLGIAASPRRTEALQSALNILGFGYNLYLIPNGLADKNGVIPEGKQADILDLIRLPKDVLLPKKFSLAILAPDNRVIPFEKLSSGEQQLVTLAVKLCAFAERGWVIFIDEPELSLHVSWQRALPRMLTDLSRHLECALVVATHSPVLMAATGPEDYCFQAERQMLNRLTHSSLASVETVLFEDFGTYTANTRRVHELCAQTVASVMHRLNAEKPMPSKSVRDDALKQLDKIKDVVKAAGRTGDGSERDLELVRRARAAVAEVFAQLDFPVEESGGSGV